MRTRDYADKIRAEVILAARRAGLDNLAAGELVEEIVAVCLEVRRAEGLELAQKLDHLSDTVEDAGRKLYSAHGELTVSLLDRIGRE